MQKQIANIIVACSKRKTRVIDESLRIGSLNSGSIDEFVNAWISRLKNADSPKIAAERLYAGDHWKVAKSLVQTGLSAGIDVKLWVCSAGYGLIPVSAELKSYSATFNSQDSDALRPKLLALGVQDLIYWWNQLSLWEGPVPGSPRSIKTLAESYKDCPLFFVASSDYIKATSQDLEAAKLCLSDPRLMMIVTGGTIRNQNLADNQILVNSKLQQIVGGALVSLNIRVVRHILQNISQWPVYSDDIQKLTSHLIELQSVPQKIKRTAMSDTEVMHFINDSCKNMPKSSAGKLLSMLRLSGHACEQKRFQRLYKQSIGGIL